MRECIESLKHSDNLICVGLDPDLNKIPLEFSSLDSIGAITSFISEIVKLTSKYAAAFKIQKAFIDLYDGPTLLKKIVKICHKICPEKPVFIDCKIGDIENTMSIYLKNIFENANADGVVINPFMGREIFEALQKYPDRASLVLIRTSNKGAGIIQDIVINKNGKRLCEYILEKILRYLNKNKNIIPIVSEYSRLSNLRRKFGDELIFLYAGVGAQGGNLNKIISLLNKENSGVIINSSRSILYPYDKEDKNWRSKVVYAIEELNKKILDIKGKNVQK